MKQSAHPQQEGGVTRRRFVELTIGGGAALFAGGSSILRAAAPATTENNPIFKIGGELPVNRLGFGAMRITGPGIWGWPKDREEAKRVLKRAVELGVDLIDTADAYGPHTSELLIAEALHPYPKGLVIATKGGNTRPGPGSWVPDGRPEYLKQCVDGSLKQLPLERIDLYQLHRVDPKVPMEDSLGALKEMRDAGKIRYVGLSEVGPDVIERARKILPIATVQNRYNIDDRKWDNALRYLLQVALVAGFCEEVIFRGTVIRRLEAILPKNRMAEIIILFASAGIFGAAHAYQAPAGILLTGLIGLLFGWVYIVCGRLLWPVILMHTTYDLLSLTAISSNLDRVLQTWSLNLFSWLP